MHLLGNETMEHLDWAVFFKEFVDLGEEVVDWAVLNDVGVELLQVSTDWAVLAQMFEESVDWAVGYDVLLDLMKEMMDGMLEDGVEDGEKSNTGEGHGNDWVVHDGVLDVVDGVVEEVGVLDFTEAVHWVSNAVLNLLWDVFDHIDSVVELVLDVIWDHSDGVVENICNHF